VGFLRRLLGGERSEPETPETPAPLDDAGVAAAEAAYERDLLREEQARLSELTRRQLRYAEYAWKPPDQGGPRRADDPEEGTETPTEGA
jgi:hypothetical protein